MKPEQFFHDKGKSQLSASRLVLFLWATGVLVIWMYVSIANGALTPIPESVVTILGIVVGGKTVQRFGEK